MFKYLLKVFLAVSLCFAFLPAADNGTFLSYKLKIDRFSEKENYFGINSFAFEPGNPGTLWFIISGKLYKSYGRDLIAEKVKVPLDVQSFENITCLPSGDFYLLGNTGNSRYALFKRVDGKFKTVIPEIRITSPGKKYFIDSRNRIWYVNPSWELCCIDGETKSSYKLPEENTVSGFSDLKNNFIELNFYEGASGRVYFSFKGGGKGSIQIKKLLCFEGGKMHYLDTAVLPNRCFGEIVELDDRLLFQVVSGMVQIMSAGIVKTPEGVNELKKNEGFPEFDRCALIDSFNAADGTIKLVIRKTTSDVTSVWSYSKGVLKLILEDFEPGRSWNSEINNYFYKGPGSEYYMLSNTGGVYIFEGDKMFGNIDGNKGLNGKPLQLGRDGEGNLLFFNRDYNTRDGIQALKVDTLKDLAAQSVPKKLEIFKAEGRILRDPLGELYWIEKKDFQEERLMHLKKGRKEEILNIQPLLDEGQEKAETVRYYFDFAGVDKNGKIWLGFRGYDPGVRESLEVYFYIYDPLTNSGRFTPLKKEFAALASTGSDPAIVFTRDTFFYFLQKDKAYYYLKSWETGAERRVYSFEGGKWSVGNISAGDNGEIVAGFIKDKNGDAFINYRTLGMNGFDETSYIRSQGEWRKSKELRQSPSALEKKKLLELATKQSGLDLIYYACKLGEEKSIFSHYREGIVYSEKGKLYYFEGLQDEGRQIEDAFFDRENNLWLGMADFYTMLKQNYFEVSKKPFVSKILQIPTREEIAIKINVKPEERIVTAEELDKMFLLLKSDKEEDNINAHNAFLGFGERGRKYLETMLSDEKDEKTIWKIKAVLSNY